MLHIFDPALPIQHQVDPRSGAQVDPNRAPSIFIPSSVILRTAGGLFRSEQNFAQFSVDVADKPAVKTGQVLEVSQGALACLALHWSTFALHHFEALTFAGLQCSILWGGAAVHLTAAATNCRLLAPCCCCWWESQGRRVRLTSCLHRHPAHRHRHHHPHRHPHHHLQWGE